jgi:aspartyl/asparaginyl-tRNA synthetase
MNKVADKVDGYGAIIDRIEATADYWKSQADKCKTVEKSLNNLSASLKNNLKNYMLTNQQKELSAQHYKFVLSSVKEKLVIEDEKAIPEEFKIQTISYDLNKDKISECLRVGQSVPGAKLEGGFSLRKYLNRGI